MRRALAFIQTIIAYTFLALLLVPLIGPALYLEFAGAQTSGAITAKQEKITFTSNVWTRQLVIDVRYQPTYADRTVTTGISVDTTTYDRLCLGEAVQLRYIPHPLFEQLHGVGSARLGSQQPMGAFVARLGPFLLGVIIGVGVWLALLFAWSKWKHWSLALALLISMLGTTIYLGSDWPRPAPAGAQAHAQATVRSVHRIERVWGGRRTASEEAVQPYTIVELGFVPAGRTDPVVAIDMIDADSVPGVEVGATVPVRYSVDEPRWVQIDGAVRTYYWKNLRTFGLLSLLILALLCGSWGIRRWRAAHHSAVKTP